MGYRPPPPPPLTSTPHLFTSALRAPASPSIIAGEFWEHICRVLLGIFSIIDGGKPKRKNSEPITLHGDTEYAQDILCISNDAADQLITVNIAPDPPPRTGHK